MQGATPTQSHKLHPFFTNIFCSLKRPHSPPLPHTTPKPPSQPHRNAITPVRRYPKPGTCKEAQNSRHSEPGTAKKAKTDDCPNLSVSPTPPIRAGVKVRAILAASLTATTPGPFLTLCQLPSKGWRWLLLSLSPLGIGDGKCC